MPPFNQLVAAFFQATNENNAALLSTKFDFTLLKLEAPAEFASIGPALSPQRRIDAEAGTVHRTARRLAALFEQIIPSTPTLVSAYGKRVSSIANDPRVNPKGSRKESFLAPFVGLNGTAIWAAATSGIPAIGVYLLACLLARAWNPREAVAIWFELVEERKSKVRAEFEADSNVPEATLLSSLQQVTRDELALWDDSARSWLLSADQVMQWHLKQLELITKGTALSFRGAGTMYEKVCSTWKQAMEGIESLLNGSSQEISDASILLAFSAWHLFPDLIVLANGATKVPFRDDLFPQCAVGTIGLSFPNTTRNRGMQWSLTLSHLQYYGPPIDVQGETSQPRITFSQLRLAALGALFYKWKVQRSEYEAVARFISGLWELLLEAAKFPGKPTIQRCFGWLNVFVKASNEFLAAKANSTAAEQECLRLISFGHRRGWDFIGPAHGNLAPLFGLRRQSVLDALMAENDSDCGILYMHSVARALGITDSDVVVLKSHWSPGDQMADIPTFFEIVLVTPHNVVTGKRNRDGSHISRAVRGRWFLAARGEADVAVRIQERRAQCHAPDEFSSTLLKETLVRWHAEDTGMMSSFPWAAPELLNGIPNCLGIDERNASSNLPCKCFELGASANFKSIFGDFRCGLFSRHHRTLSKHEKLLETDDALHLLRATCNPDTLWSYIAALSRTSNICRPATVGVHEVAKNAAFSKDVSRAMQALAMADLIFENISPPTISQTCINTMLHEMEWIPDIVLPSAHDASYINEQHAFCQDGVDRFLSEVSEFPSRAQSFACITLFDSGHLDVNPNDLSHVLAVSSGNSIYVTGKALSDPAIRTPEHDIRHVIGSIGEKGISMLVAPIDPQIRKLGTDYRLVAHVPYDHRREDNFKNTTLHLSFTRWVQPLTSDRTERAIDQDIYFVESVISVRDQGKWVADLDILGIDDAHVLNLQAKHDCNGTHQLSTKHDRNIEYTAIDSWEEFLDHPVSIGIFRAHGNWAARLAATSILFQRGYGHCIGTLPQSPFCLYCMEEGRTDDETRRRDESLLPSFCLD